jgi:hypothetical protein
LLDVIVVDDDLVEQLLELVVEEKEESSDCLLVYLGTNLVQIDPRLLHEHPVFIFSHFGVQFEN